MFKSEHLMCMCDVMWLVLAHENINHIRTCVSKRQILDRLQNVSMSINHEHAECTCFLQRNITLKIWLGSSISNSITEYFHESSYTHLVFRYSLLLQYVICS